MFLLRTSVHGSPLQIGRGYFDLCYGGLTLLEIDAEILAMSSQIWESVLGSPGGLHWLPTCGRMYVPSCNVVPREARAG